MRRVIAPIALACAAIAAVPAAAQSVSVTTRATGPGVEVYVEAQTYGVPPATLYDHARSERRLVPRTAPPPVGSFAYFGTQGATAVAVVTHVHVDGTVTLLHQDPYGHATEIHMNLRYPQRHRRAGRVVNDYVSFTGHLSLAPVVFYGYSQPPPRVIVVNTPHGGHRGGVGPRDHREQRMTCLPPGHPGRGHAWGHCKNHGAHPRPVDGRYDDDDDHHHHWDDDDHHHDYADRGRDRDDDDKHKHGKKGKKHKKNKHKKGKKGGKRGDKHEDRHHDDDNRSRKRFDV